MTELDRIHREAWEERQKAPVMEDPQVATPGTAEEVLDDVRENLEAELDGRFSPVGTRVESLEDSAWNPEGSNVDEEEEVEEAQDADSAYDPVTTTNDIRLDPPEGEDVDTEGSTPEEDTEYYADLEDEDEDVSELDSTVDNRDQVDDALGRDDEDDLDDLTKAELLERAADADVKGRSSMDKDELKDALRNS